MGGAFSTACSRIEARSTGVRLSTGVANSCYPSPGWFLSAAPKGGGCGGKKLAPCDRIGIRCRARRYSWKPAATMPSVGISVYHSYE
jgi:hypothetical protein